VRGQPGALGAERLLDDLDEDLLPFLEQVLDLQLGALAVAVARPLPPAALAAGLDGRDLGGRGDRSRLPVGDHGLDRLGQRGRLGGGFLLLVARLEPVELLGGRDDLGDVEEGVALEADVNEGGLHAGQHLRHPALVDVANDAALAFPLDEDLDDLVVLEDGDPRVVGAGGDDHLLVHG
jgi:hypothetical protein